MFPKSIRRVSLSGQVWGIIPDTETDSFFLEVRDEKVKTCGIWKVDLLKDDLEELELNFDWWSKLIGADNNQLYFVAYNDLNDPTKQSFFSIGLLSGEKEEIEQIPEIETFFNHPNIYEYGTEYFKTVADFLSLELPLSCEYLEWNNKIIISYYLRSDNGFDRFLLLLRDGKKEWKIQQDSQMKGFAPGSFFVHNDQIIFIKDRNEVCVYAE
ncbi:hypothetical protein [Ekhidna sp.]|uniref:hypothetical protein n=1 Tax=Ekhidna sp. TaxID=2608089 RepID=UPI00329A4BE1